MREQAKAGFGSGAESKSSYESTVWNWGIAGTFAVDVLSDIYDTFVFPINKASNKFLSWIAL